MILRINLLPPSERACQWPVQKLLLAGVILVFGTMALFYGYGAYTIWRLDRQLADIRNQYELFKPVREKMVTANILQQAIKGKNDRLAALTGERRSWYAILSHIGAVMPPGIWLTEVTLSDKSSIRIKGLASAYPDLARFLDQFADDSLLKDPFLVSAETDAASAATRFEMTLKFKGL